MLLGGGSVVELVKLYRVVWIGGRYGGGKTAIAYRLAYELLNSGFSRYLLSNTRSVWADKPADVVLRDGRFMDVCMILDEGGLFLRTGKDTEEYLAFMRKFNLTMLIPSQRPVPRSVAYLTIQRLFDFQKIGLPLWWYKASLRYDAIAESYYFGWWFPSEIYGIYDTLDIPVDDGGISDWISENKVRLIEKAGQGKHDKRKLVVPTMEGFGGDLAGQALLDVAEEIRAVVPLLESSGNGGRRKRRR